ncbi:hypothetical protein C7476_101653 [Phyllobacterium bourgognense]|uniref:Uncharacterized protein n=1 Tax=Phyllobacterium bourgognense TaxID=314236 RepID=A0A368ZBN2_9HYPH|nr:hypothetical protein C7476_101653 [Phyllobacterium bourgognense]
MRFSGAKQELALYETIPPLCGKRERQGATSHANQAMTIYGCITTEQDNPYSPSPRRHKTLTGRVD